ncbi:MAG TPA: hypothetical protein VFK12_09125, partial [Gammaproteobacteria bacterium]|nr:hypothetical protein [Gammaproteobacteria bacterium]
ALQNADGTPYSSSATIAFTSTCATAGTATITSPITASNGTAQTVYTPKGCTGQDTITATTVIGGTTLTATGNVTVIQSSPTALSFISATPSTIGLQGSGQATSSTVVFQLLDTTGNPVSNQEVDFSLSTNVGGITLAPTSGKTDGSGMVSTVVQAGTVHTSVVVTASLPAGSSVPDAQSSALTISTGIPTQNNFSISVASHNIDAWAYNGVTDVVSVILSDRFNNPVPDGTAVAFTTDGGTIEPSCFTTNGACTVTWTSAEPRPAGNTLLPGRVAILAYAVGEESFLDKDGNGVFNNGDAFTDIPEIFLDSNEDGTYTSGVDPFFYDFDNNSAYTAADSKWEGLLCKDSTRCGTRSTTGVGKQVVITMSSDTPLATAGNLSIASGDITIYVTDSNGNPLPAGTTFTVSQPSGCTGSAPQVFPTTQPDTNGYTAIPSVLPGTINANVAPQLVDITGVVASGCPPGSNLSLVVTTPASVATHFPFTVTP